MAIGSMHIEWLSTLALQSKIPPNAAVFDLGSQDLWTEREPLRRVARRHLSPDACETAIHEIFGDEAKPGSDAQRAFYSIFGAQTYRSLDLTDPRADYAYDLSYPLPDIGKYDVVTNFGTTEHVFNIGQSSRTSTTCLTSAACNCIHCRPTATSIMASTISTRAPISIWRRRTNTKSSTSTTSTISTRGWRVRSRMSPSISERCQSN